MTNRELKRVTVRKVSRVQLLEKCYEQNERVLEIGKRKEKDSCIVMAHWWVYGVVVRISDFHRCDRGSNPGRGGKISCLRLHYRAAPLASV